MLVALATAATTPDGCVVYRAGKNELVIGRTEAVKRRHASAYRHYARGLKLIDQAYHESLAQLIHRFSIKDDTSFLVTIADDEYRRGRFGKAADGVGEVLKERLENINEANGCKR